jgi:hypothetical protein
MKEIWKYNIASNGAIEMPVGAVILTAREQRDATCIWALVDPNERLERRRFVVYGTGNEVDQEDLKYIGTAIHMHGALVLHVFEELIVASQ